MQLYKVQDYFHPYRILNESHQQDILFINKNL
jgi:hypothetical protein